MSFLFLGGVGGATKMPQRDWEGLRILKEWVAELLGMKGGEARELVEEVAKRNAKMVAGWQVKRYRRLVPRFRWGTADNF